MEDKKCLNLHLFAEDQDLRNWIGPLPRHSPWSFLGARCFRASLERPREGPGREVDAKRVERASAQVALRPSEKFEKKIPSLQVLHLNSVTKDVLVHTGAADRNPECVSYISYMSMGAKLAASFGAGAFTRCGLWLLPSLINHSCQPNALASSAEDGDVVKW